MTTEQLRHLHRRHPFQPFRIHRADGRDLDVVHPENLALSSSGRTITVATPQDTFEIVDLLLVTSLELINGQPRPRRRRT